MPNKSFVFHGNWKEILLALPEQVRLEVYDAIVEYGLSGTLSGMSAMAEVVFSIARNDIDNDNHRAESIRRKRSEAGRKHKGNQHTLKVGTNGTSVPNQWNKCSKTPLNKEILIGTSVPNQKLKERSLPPPIEETSPITPIEDIPPIIPQENLPPLSRAKKFVKPTIEEIESYCKMKGYVIDAEQFWNFYESKGWVVGKSPMKSWKAACVTWTKRNKNGTTKTNQGSGNESDHPSDSELLQQSVRIMQRFESERNARQATVRQCGGFPEEGKP